MIRKGWYMVVYDISDPKRLRRIHYRIKKEGVAAQKSVFFVKGTEADLNGLLDRLASEMDPKADDLRAYPVVHPSKVWSNGPNPLAHMPAVRFGDEKRVSVPTARNAQKSGWLKRLLR